MPQTPANALLRDAIMDRGRIYLAVFRELSKRYGEEEAVSVMHSASYAHGKDYGRSLACYAPRDFAGMFEAFAKAPDDGETYSPHVRQLDDTCLDVQMMKCPLRDSWIEAGCSDEEVCTLLRCASGFDHGTYEAAGFDYELELWSPGKDGCCRTRLFEKLQSRAADE